MLKKYQLQNSIQRNKLRNYSFNNMHPSFSAEQVKVTITIIHAPAHNLWSTFVSRGSQCL